LRNTIITVFVYRPNVLELLGNASFGRSATGGMARLTSTALSQTGQRRDKGEIERQYMVAIGYSSAG
jgi:hypothetical protein